ncbi:MAG: DUF7482 domain-containing protein [Burkholderiaceae bacterium]
MSTTTMPIMRPDKFLLASGTTLFALFLYSQSVHAQYAEPNIVVAPSKNKLVTVEFPVVSGWYEGRVVQYITTDVSDKEIAKKMGVNFVPRLADAIPPLPHTPGQRSSVERIYSFTNFKQGGVLPSIPEPTGAESTNKNYSPLWHMHTVTWLPGHEPRVLRSEEEVLSAADKGQVSIKQTNIVINCPVIFSEQGGALPRIKIKTEESAQR